MAASAAALLLLARFWRTGFLDELSLSAGLSYLALLVGAARESTSYWRSVIVAASLEEMDRAIGKLGAKGIQIFTNVNGRPLDEPEFFPLFERMAKKYDLPVWVHPSRTAKFADYPTEQKSKYEIW